MSGSQGVCKCGGQRILAGVGPPMYHVGPRDPTQGRHLVQASLPLIHLIIPMPSHYLVKQIHVDVMRYHPTWSPSSPYACTQMNSF